MWAIILWFGLAIAVGAMAGNRGRNGFGWFLLALIISPLLASVFLFASPDLHAQKLIVEELRSSKKCPFCAEIIKLEASVCRYCGRDVATAPIIIDAEPTSHQNAETRGPRSKTETDLVEYRRSANPIEESRYAIVSGDDAYLFEIVGESHYQDGLEEIVGSRTEEGANFYCAALLVPEPANRYDRNAVCVIISRRTVGYLRREHAIEFQRALAAGGYVGGACASVIVGGWDRGDDQGYFGVKLNIALPFLLADAPSQGGATAELRERRPALERPTRPIARRTETVEVRNLMAVVVLVLIVVAAIAIYFANQAPTPQHTGFEMPVAPAEPVTSLPSPAAPPAAENVPLPRAKPLPRKAPDPPLNLTPAK